MRDKQLRMLKDRLLEPIAHATGARLHPTAISLIGFAVGLIACAAALAGSYFVGLVLWLLNRTIDGLDGTVARATNRQSDLGGYIDILLDSVIYAALPIALALSVETEVALIAALILLASFYVNTASWMGLSAILERRKQTDSRQTTLAMPGGLIEGAETILFYCLFFLRPEHLVSLFLIMAALVTVTVGQRLIWAVRHL